MTGSLWWDLAIGLAVALVLTWLALVVALVVVRPRGGLLREALRILPDARASSAASPPTRHCPAAYACGWRCC